MCTHHIARTHCPSCLTIIQTRTSETTCLLANAASLSYDPDDNSVPNPSCPGDGWDNKETRTVGKDLCQKCDLKRQQEEWLAKWKAALRVPGSDQEKAMRLMEGEMMDRYRLMEEEGGEGHDGGDGEGNGGGGEGGGGQGDDGERKGKMLLPPAEISHSRNKKMVEAPRENQREKRGESKDEGEKRNIGTSSYGNKTNQQSNANMPLADKTRKEKEEDYGKIVQRRVDNMRAKFLEGLGPKGLEWGRPRPGGNTAHTGPGDRRGMDSGREGEGDLKEKEKEKRGENQEEEAEEEEEETDSEVEILEGMPVGWKDT